MVYQKREAVPRAATSCALPQLITRNAPLGSDNLLVLMYDGRQVPMPSAEKQGVSAWLKEAIAKYGMPSLIRFGRKDRAFVLRRDEFIGWFTPLLDKKEA